MLLMVEMSWRMAGVPQDETETRTLPGGLRQSGASFSGSGRKGCKRVVAFEGAGQFYCSQRRWPLLRAGHMLSGLIIWPALGQPDFLPTGPDWSS